MLQGRSAWRPGEGAGRGARQSASISRKAQRRLGRELQQRPISATSSGSAGLSQPVALCRATRIARGARCATAAFPHGLPVGDRAQLAGRLQAAISACWSSPRSMCSTCAAQWPIAVRVGLLAMLDFQRQPPGRAATAAVRRSHAAARPGGSRRVVVHAVDGECNREARARCEGAAPAGSRRAPPAGRPAVIDRGLRTEGAEEGRNAQHHQRLGHGLGVAAVAAAPAAAPGAPSA